NIPLVEGGGGGVLPPQNQEMIIFKIKDGKSFHEYRLSVRRSFLESTWIIDMIKDQRVVFEKELENVKSQIKNLVEKNDIWSYDNFLNYSIKIFLFDSPMTPHIGFVN